ncbi:hypothetical protein [Methylovulum psychrotolerans]|uniref:Uncharacterized protein n=1 Tax=Methylovulum psychrotolerans TaxID=1704499 RepID=A0A2S5CPY8_9GAMM|nr:hypothetical protein [Methylovulum psychrotolerans]POZ52864.1 hypothetical protein AADEFJLK_01473 [Methylovulum psychrotolerans]
MPFKQILEYAKIHNIIVSAYVNANDWGQYSVGYVDSITNGHVRLRTLSKYGENAGFEIRLLSDIVKIEYDGKYEKKIELLNKKQGKVFNEIDPNKISSGNLFEDALKQSLEDSVVIVIWGNDPDDSLVGIVEKLDSELISVRLVNEFGEDDGLSTIKIDEINSIDFNTQSEQVRSFLYKHSALIPNSIG